MRFVRTKARYYWLILTPILSFFPFAHRATTGQDVGVPTPVIVSLYSPVEADLLAEYSGDRTNKKVQTWQQYWDWVQIFYNGNFLSAGWTRFSQVNLDVVKSEAKRPAVLLRLNEAGKLISREWAKDASVRKINTTDLRRWNETISEARRHDDGSGQQLLNALETILEKVETIRGR